MNTIKNLEVGTKVKGLEGYARVELSYDTKYYANIDDSDAAEMDCEFIDVSDMDVDYLDN